MLTFAYIFCFHCTKLFYQTNVLRYIISTCFALNVRCRLFWNSHLHHDSYRHLIMFAKKLKPVSDINCSERQEEAVRLSATIEYKDTFNIFFIFYMNKVED